MVVIQYEGQFIDKDTVKDGNILVKEKRFNLSTESSTFIPERASLDSANYLTNESIFDIQDLPKRLIIIGGSPIGVEIAQAFYRL